MPREAEPHVYKRADRGAWYVRFRTPDGRQVNRRAGTTKSEANRYARALREELVAPLVPPAPTLAAFIADHYAAALAIRVAASTYKDQSRQLLAAAEAFEGVPMRGVTVASAQAFLEGLIGGRGFSPATARRYRSALSKAWASAARVDLLERNVWREVQLPRETRTAPPFLSERELRALYRAVPRYYRASAVFLGETGADVGAARRLTWAQVGEDLAFAAWTRQKTGALVHVPLRRLARAALRRLLAERVAPLTGADRVFAKGGVWTRPGQEAWRRATKAIGHEGLLRRHLRHVRGSLLVRAGVPIPTVARWLGHSGPAMVLERYGHLAPSGELQHALELSERALIRRNVPLEETPTRAQLETGDLTALGHSLHAPLGQPEHVRDLARGQERRRAHRRAHAQRSSSPRRATRARAIVFARASWSSVGSAPARARS